MEPNAICRDEADFDLLLSRTARDDDAREIIRILDPQGNDRLLNLGSPLHTEVNRVAGSRLPQLLRAGYSRVFRRLLDLENCVTRAASWHTGMPFDLR
jgi:hypothetical protein